MNDEKIISLRKPVTFGDITYVEIALREPVALELSIASKTGNQIDMSMSLVSQIAKIPMKVVNQLCQRDLTEASEYLSGFTIDGPPIGEMSLPS